MKLSSTKIGLALWILGLLSPVLLYLFPPTAWYGDRQILAIVNGDFPQRNFFDSDPYFFLRLDLPDPDFLYSERPAGWDLLETHPSIDRTNKMGFHKPEYFARPIQNGLVGSIERIAKQNELLLMIASHSRKSSNLGQRAFEQKSTAEINALSRALITVTNQNRANNIETAEQFMAIAVANAARGNVQESLYWSKRAVMAKGDDSLLVPQSDFVAAKYLTLYGYLGSDVLMSWHFPQYAIGQKALFRAYYFLRPNASKLSKSKPIIKGPISQLRALIVAYYLAHPSFPIGPDYFSFVFQWNSITDLYSNELNQVHSPSQIQIRTVLTQDFAREFDMHVAEQAAITFDAISTLQRRLYSLAPLDPAQPQIILLSLLPYWILMFLAPILWIANVGTIIALPGRFVPKSRALALVAILAAFMATLIDRTVDPDFYISMGLFAIILGVWSLFASSKNGDILAIAALGTYGLLRLVFGLSQHFWVTWGILLAILAILFYRIFRHSDSQVPQFSWAATIVISVVCGLSVMPSNSLYLTSLIALGFAIAGFAFIAIFYGKPMRELLPTIFRSILVVASTLSIMLIVFCGAALTADRQFQEARVFRASEVAEIRTLATQHADAFRSAVSTYYSRKPLLEALPNIK